MQWQGEWLTSAVWIGRTFLLAGIGFAIVLMLVQLGFERGFFDASLGILRELDGDLFIMRASKYRFGSEDPFPASNLKPAREVAGATDCRVARSSSG